MINKITLKKITNSDRFEAVKIEITNSKLKIENIAYFNIYPRMQNFRSSYDGTSENLWTKTQIHPTKLCLIIKYVE